MKVRDMVHCSVCAGLMAVCAWLAVPVGDTVITMQTFALFFTLAALGGSRGVVVCAVYLLLGAIGLPVFSGFQGGFGVLLGPTGGYLWGFLPAAVVYRLTEKRLSMWLGMTAALLMCYLCGSLWFYYAYTDGGLWLVILRCVIPCILPDALKMLLALTLQKRLIISGKRT